MKKQKSLTNKGFSLVELIIVVAILAILMAILAPQYLRYVERARLQKDNSSIGEFANAIKLAVTDEDIVQEMNGLDSSKTVEFEFTSTSGVIAPSGGTAATFAEIPKLKAEIEASVGSFTDIVMTSNTYRTTGPTVIVSIDSNNVITVTAKKWVDKPGATPTGDTPSGGGTPVPDKKF